MTESMQEIHYTEIMIRRSARQSIVRNLGSLYWIIMLMLSISVSIGLWRGNHDWFIGTVATLLTLVIVVPLVVWRQHTAAALRRLRKLDQGKLSIDILAARLHLSSKLGDSDIPLASITKLLRAPDYWVFMSDKAVVMTLPILELPLEVQQRWLQELQAAGTQI